MKPRSGGAHPLRLLDVHMARARAHRNEIDLAAWVAANEAGLRAGVARYESGDPDRQHRAEKLRDVLAEHGLEP